jgi:RNA polymerase-associated protein RTF1
MLERKKQLTNSKPPGWATFEKSRLNQARALAFRRHDFIEVAQIDEQLLAAFGAPGDGTTDGTDVTGKGESHSRERGDDVLAKLSEKNRKANIESVRKAEVMEAERRRRERKLAMSGSGTSTPTDPSARLKTIPRTLVSANQNSPSRTGTPGPAGTPLLKPQGSPNKRSVSPLPGGKTFESSVAKDVEVDLGDF